MSRLYLIDAPALGAWKFFGISDSSAHSDITEGIKFWWEDFAHKYNPANAVACFDCSRESNWRKKLFAEYKSARDARPKDKFLAEAMAQLPEIFDSLGVPCWRMSGFEADDLIATLAAEHDGEVIVITSDKDMMQLVDERVRVFDPRPDKEGKCTLYDEAGVMAKFNLPPHRLREYLAIAGDSADSIPGVKGWGNTKAVNAIKQTRSRAELVRKAKAGELKDITVKNQASFIEQLDAFELSFQLVGLRFDVPIPFPFTTAVKAPKEAA